MSQTSTTTDQPLTVDVERREAAAVVRLCGAADMDVCPQLREHLLSLASEGIPKIVLDLTGLTFICSISLGDIVAAHSRCRHHDGVILLAGPRPHVADVLEKTRLTRLFSVFDTVEDALAG